MFAYCCCEAEEQAGMPDLVRVNKPAKCVTSLCTGETDDPDVVQSEHLPALLGQVHSQVNPLVLKDAKAGQIEQMEPQYAAVTETYDELQVHVEDMPATWEQENENETEQASPEAVPEETSPGISSPDTRASEMQHRASRSTLSWGNETVETSAPLQPEPSEFTIEITKDVAKHGAGLEIQAIDDMLIILRHGDGPIREWNASHDPSLAIAPGDHIVAVNDVDSDAEAILAAIKSSTTLRMRIRRPAYFRIKVDKNGKGLGAALLVNVDPLGMLTIHQMREGALKDWNIQNPSQPLRSGDRILWVNGVKGKPEGLLARVKTDAQLDMVMLRLR